MGGTVMAALWTVDRANVAMAVAMVASLVVIALVTAAHVAPCVVTSHAMLVRTVTVALRTVAHAVAVMAAATVVRRVVTVRLTVVLAHRVAVT